MIKTWAEHALQGRMNLREQAADAVADLRDLCGQVIVKAAQHAQFSELITAGLEGAQGMGHGAGRLGDDGGIAGIGLGLPGVQVGDAPHRQSRQAAHRDALAANHAPWQGTDGGGLVHDSCSCPWARSLPIMSRSCPSSLGRALSYRRLPERSRATA